MTGTNEMRENDYQRAARLLEEFAPNMLAPQTDGEVWCVLDAVANEEDPSEHLEEYRFWRSPHGRQVEAYEGDR